MKATLRPLFLINLCLIGLVTYSLSSPEGEVVTKPGHDSSSYYLRDINQTANSGDYRDEEYKPGRTKQAPPYVLERQKQKIDISVDGYLQANQVVKLGVETGGLVKSMFVEPGMFVQTNQPLAVIYNSEMQTRLLQIQQQVDQLDQTLNTHSNNKGELILQADLASTQYTNLKREYERIRGLEGTGIPAAEVEQLEGKLTAARQQRSLSVAQIESTRLKRNHLMAMQHDLQQKIDRLTIRSPFDGVVVQTFVYPGEYCTPAPMGVIVELMETNPLKVQFSVSEEYKHLFHGAQIEMKLTIGQDEFPVPHEAMIPRIESTTRALRFEMRIPNEGNQYIVGAYVQSTLELHHTALYIPQKSIYLDEQQQYFVYVKKDHTTEKQIVELGINAGDYREVLQGLEPGDTIIAEQ
jgi:RND family efflux transporter MFP subunit